LWEQYKRIIKDNGAIVLFGSQPFTTDLINSNRKWFKRCLYWKKERGTGFARANKEELRVIEEIIIFCKSSTIYNPIMKKLEKPYSHILPIKKSLSDNISCKNLDANGDRIYKKYTESYPTNLLVFSRDFPKLHLTQKPLGLCEYLIKTYSNENDLILDNCMGSGTTIVASNNLNRNSIGIELDKDIFNLAKNRIEKQKENKEGQLF
jgi:site-specific DNA-methyltransferase (adenine-specific)